MNRCGQLLHHHHVIDAERGGQRPHLLMPGALERPEFGQVSQDRHGAPPPPNVGQRAQGGRGGGGVGVVRVVDHRDPIRPVEHVHPSWRHGTQVAQRLGHLVHRHAERQPDRRHRQRVRHLVGTGHPQPHRRRPALGHQPVVGAPPLVQGHLLRPDVGVGGLPIPEHPGRGVLRHRRHLWIIGVQDRQPTGRQRLDQLPLGGGDRLHAAELPQMGAADVEHHPDVRRGHPAQVGDVPHPPGGLLQHQVPSVRAGPQHRVRQPEFVVERPGRGDGVPQPAGQLRQQVLGGGLAGGAGHPDHRQLVGQPGPHVPGQRGHGRQRIGHQHRRHLVLPPGAHHRHRSGGPGGPGEVVPVHPAADERHEQISRTDLAGIELHSTGHPRGRVRPGQRAPGHPRDLRQIHLDHAVPPAFPDRSARSRNSSANATRSSNGCI